MAPLKPHWKQPSHPGIQELIISNDQEFTSKSLSKISVAPFGLYAKMDFPPCTLSETPTYATVQCGLEKHLDLNSDLMFINHSCEPSLIFDTVNFNVIAGPQGLAPGDELTFFYPSTEWSMAQPFACTCGKPTCRGRISGAGDMTPAQLDGVWLNLHIRELLDQKRQKQTSVAGGTQTESDGAGKVLAGQGDAGSPAGLTRRGASSRELSGEMGGDTVVA
ncbi:Uu.00g074180.m01.CDS01 [Anthostomella pinea]|uniref:Uu.00g074180.m01.CDS01 n=1 Tax=Anthostomella pinea TaxID=933095 RepID=A0AAI8YP00_9PEZI|nr:Uu.00g074180.m01.CDS01 [Anthostomella pinea]